MSNPVDTQRTYALDRHRRLRQNVAGARCCSSMSGAHRPVMGAIEDGTTCSRLRTGRSHVAAAPSSLRMRHLPLEQGPPLPAWTSRATDQLYRRPGLPAQGRGRRPSSCMDAVDGVRPLTRRILERSPAPKPARRPSCSSTRWIATAPTSRWPSTACPQRWA